MENGPKTWLLVRLGIPLLMLFALSVGLHGVVDADGFFLNLATELIGIGVTVVYVDRVLRRHEAEQWETARALIDGRIQLTVNRGLTTLRTALKFDYDVLGSVNPNQASSYREAIRRVMVPAYPKRVEALTQDQWKTLAEGLRETAAEADVILRTFGNRLRPAEYGALLTLQDHIRSALVGYEVFPELLGSDCEVASPAHIVGHEYHTSTAIREIGSILDQLLQLGDTLPDDSGERKALPR